MRFLLLGASCVAALALTGCPNPNAIGIQKYGTIAAQCLLASNNQPVSGALVTVNSTQQCRTQADGTCQIQMVPIGVQQVTAFAAGLQSASPVTVTVIENQTVSAQIPMVPTP